MARKAWLHGRQDSCCIDNHLAAIKPSSQPPLLRVLCFARHEIEDHMNSRARRAVEQRNVSRASSGAKATYGQGGIIALMMPSLHCCMYSQLMDFFQFSDVKCRVDDGRKRNTTFHSSPGPDMYTSPLSPSFVGHSRYLPPRLPPPPQPCPGTATIPHNALLVYHTSTFTHKLTVPGAPCEQAYQS